MEVFFSIDQIRKIKKIGLEAGNIAKDFFINRKLLVTKKPDGSSVTDADIAVSEFIRQRLSLLFPSIPIVCEEGCNRACDDQFFLIDPIDGTSSFIKGEDQFTVNIALINKGRSVFGLINAPIFESGKMIFTNHQGSLTYLRGGQQECTLTAAAKSNSFTRIITSKRTDDLELSNYFKPEKFKVEKLSSSLKFLHLLENRADIYVHLRRTMEWDTAAGQAIIEAFGGKILNLTSKNDIFSGEDLIYGKQDFVNFAFVSFI